MPKIESEKIDCLYRPCSRPAHRGKIESVRTHSEVSETFDSFSMLKFLFLARNWHCWSRKAFPRQMTPQSREKTAKTAVFRHRWQAWKVVRSIAAVHQRRRTPLNWRCTFAFFETFLWHFNTKQRAEVIFRLSRPVLCKNQENDSGKRWSLHAPLKFSVLMVTFAKFFFSVKWEERVLSVCRKNHVIYWPGTGSWKTGAWPSFLCWSRSRPWSFRCHLSSCTASAWTPKKVKQEKNLSSMCPQEWSPEIGCEISSLSRSRCLQQGLHCIQEAW